MNSRLLYRISSLAAAETNTCLLSPGTGNDNQPQLEKSEQTSA